jgi:hypothetical protein
MPRRYYSSRKQPQALTLDELYCKLQNLYLLLRQKDFFDQKAGISHGPIPDAIQREARLDLNFQLFPIEKWDPEDITEDHIFDALEFLHEHTSKPGKWVRCYTDDGDEYYGYEGYDEEAGRTELRERANRFLMDYPPGYELTADGNVATLGTDGLQYILKAEIIPYDELNVDSKVRGAIDRWRNRRVSREDKKQAIRDLADVFEWLKKTGRLGKVLDNKDESAIFDLANNFAIRHHNPKQKANYDKEIWFSWIFHFYLATYHAAIRLLVKREPTKKHS